MELNPICIQLFSLIFHHQDCFRWFCMDFLPTIPQLFPFWISNGGLLSGRVFFLPERVCKAKILGCEDTVMFLGSSSLLGRIRSFIASLLFYAKALLRIIAWKVLNWWAGKTLSVANRRYPLFITYFWTAGYTLEFYLAISRQIADVSFIGPSSC